MAEIRPLGVIKDKWSRVTPQRTDDYKYGIQNPRRDWEDGASGANDTWKAGVTGAATKDMYVKGVHKAGTPKWKEKSIKKGPTRFAEGVMIGAPDYEKGFAPFHEVISSVIPPPKFPRGDPRNYERVKAFGIPLSEKRTG